jgi:hypothetical protein
MFDAFNRHVCFCVDFILYVAWMLCNSSSCISSFVFNFALAGALEYPSSFTMG